jgi:hypothetical protein
MGWRWLQARAEIPELREQMLDLGRNQSDANADGEISKTVEELSDIRFRIRKLNGLAPGGGHDISEILFALETIMPPNTVLKSFNYQRDEDAAVLEIESGDAAFLAVLEKSNPFARMTLLKQSKPQKGEMLVYEIRLAGSADGPAL